MKVEMRWTDNRPHPGPLPSTLRSATEDGQARGKCSPRVGDAYASGLRMAFLTNDRSAVAAVETIELPESANGCSLAPGERVRVRASVPLTVLSRTRWYHRSRVIGQRMRRTRLQFAEDGVPNDLVLTPQPRIPEAKLLDAHCGEKLCPFSIMGHLVRVPMVTAIELDGEAGFVDRKSVV